MAKSVYEILDITSSDIEYGKAHRYGMTAGELMEIALHRNFSFNPGVADAIIDAYLLGLVRGMQCQRYRDKN